MRPNFIKFDFNRFESLFFENNSMAYDNFYDTLDDKRIQVLFYSFLNDNPLKNINLDKLFLKDLKLMIAFLDIHRISLLDFRYFKTDLDVFSAYLFLFLIKTFEIKSKSRRFEEDFVYHEDRHLLFDRNDFINIFMNFLHKFLLFVEIKFNRTFPLSKESLRKFMFRIIALFDNKGWIQIEDISFKNRSYKILHFRLLQICHLPHIVFYTRPFRHYVRSETEFYAYNSHFFSILEITKSAKYSNSSFWISKDEVSKLFERSLYIDRDSLNMCFKWLAKDQDLDVDSDLNARITELTFKIEKFTSEKDFLSLRWCHSKLSKLFSLVRIKTVLNMPFDNLKLFLPFMFCFRGRIYELSDLSFTFYKEFRFCLYTGFYEEESEIFHPISLTVKSVLENQFFLFKDFVWFSLLSDIRKFTIVWIFVSLGALKKLELGKEVHISIFLQKGIELYTKKDVSFFYDSYEKIEFSYLLNLIDELVNTTEKLKKWIFWKDVPASCFQHLLLILGESNSDSYKICNLDSNDTWYDPYSFLIQDFFEKNCDAITKNLYTHSGLMLSEEKYFQVFSRKRLKRVLMTESYGAGYKKLTFFFKVNLNLKNRPKEEENAILAIWDKFFEYMSEENLLFAQSSKAIVNRFVEENIRLVENPDKTRVDYSCYKIKIQQSEIYIEKKRHTMQNKIITTKEDENQFKISIRANFVQTQDAVVARKYVLLTNMWSVHDCFSIDFLNITYMVSLVNELMNGQFYDLQISQQNKKLVYSIFIIL